MPEFTIPTTPEQWAAVEPQVSTERHVCSLDLSRRLAEAGALWLALRGER